MLIQPFWPWGKKSVWVVMEGERLICQPVRAGLRSLYLILPSVMHSFSYTCNLCHWLSDLPQKAVKTSSLTSGNHNSQLYLFCFYLRACRNCQFLQALLCWENVLVMQIALIHGRVLQTLSLALQGILFFNSLCCVSSSLLIWIALLIKIFEKSIRGEQVSASGYRYQEIADKRSLYGSMANCMVNYLV